MATHPNRRSWSGEEGIALVLAMFMVLIVSLLGASLATVGRTETLSSLNYKTMSQARYAAESGLHSAANYLIHTYVAPGVDAGDAMANYNVTVSPVTYNNQPVVLTTVAGEASNYPVAAKIDAFEDNATGPLQMANSETTYFARATLLSMRQFPDAYSGGNITIQTWEITGVGNIDGAGAAAVQVSAIIETQAVPAYRYAAFATKNGCAAMSFAGGGSTDSYNSTAGLVGGKPVISATDGDVGTNGNLDENGGPGTIINGTLSTPRGGVGACTANNVTALTISGKASVSEGLVKLPQAVALKTPEAINPAPSTTSIDLKKVGGCPADATMPGLGYCAASASGVTFTPPSASTVVSLGNVNVNAGAVIHLNAGIYEINSLTANGNMTLQVDSGPVVIRVNGKNGDGTEMATPIDLTGGSIIGLNFKPENLQFVYGGTGTIKMNGGSGTAALIYAPNATVTMLGNSDFYGAVVGATVNDTGGAKIHYDRNLAGWAMTEGNPTMTSFTWSSTD
jgi:hypothetical protein